MKLSGKRVLACNCEMTMAVDADKLVKACQALGGDGSLQVNSQLCRSQLENFQAALQSDDALLISCTQEAPLFSEIAAEEAPEKEISFFNWREMAGWSAEGKDSQPKLAALAAAASFEPTPTPTVSFESQGVCLVYGRGAEALEAAQQLSDKLEVTLLLTDAEGLLPPDHVTVPLYKGRIVQASGHLGAFGVTVNEHAAALPSSRQELAFEAPRDGAFSQCDLILDLTGDHPLFVGHEKRDGYLRPDPGNPLAVQKAILELRELVGEFSKPRYISYNADLCAHSRNRQTGCTRCLEVCPAGAIQSDGDVVSIDPHVCGGCGHCSSVCPTGAAHYDLPGGASLIERGKLLLTAFAKAGGQNPTLLLHDTSHGTEVISLMARMGRGLPASVLPLAVNQVTQVGLDALTSFLGYGAEQILFLVNPNSKDDLSALASQMALSEALLEGLGHGGGRLQLLDSPDPEVVEQQLYDLSVKPALPAGQFLPLGDKRTRTLLALRHLHQVAPQPIDHLPLPKGAPFGAVEVDTGGCTLCLACVATCPTGALQDNLDKPWLGFQEEACVQCGLCQSACPEKVITLKPRFNFTNDARSAITLNEAEPFECISCGTPFGVKQSIDRIVEKLGGKHNMFMDPERIKRLQMCDTCRVEAEFNAPDNPFAQGSRPRTRTTEDDLQEREDIRLADLADKRNLN
ncbi:4Fe-4S dicluster domain-containing protein [Rhodovibrionaceae bacterium A322]